ncbi:hypothetical protein [Psychroflexus aestuariivivens]|uniref:hypothetical protein n=1 Tax=Psychroflexus aestuariivivens TaxID=1795040 RepID=UPI000FD974F9|nr:hypothetical protein [Psychroflexus aestuariivivens]
MNLKSYLQVEMRALTEFANHRKLTAEFRADRQAQSQLNISKEIENPRLNRIHSTTPCIFNGEVWELKVKVWDFFGMFTTDKRKALLSWSPLKDTQIRWQ